VSDSTDITTIWKSAKQGFGAQEFAGLVRAGVSKEFLAAELYRDLWIGALDIAIQNGKWRQMFRGERALVLPIVSPESGDIIDLAAFRPETPRSTWLFTGAGRFLGDEAIRESEHFGKPLEIRETPLDWLKARCTGLVILDWKQLWPFWFAGVPALKFDDRDFAGVARAMLERPFHIPPVLVPAP
jgi:hypothetical protein